MKQTHRGRSTTCCIALALTITACAETEVAVDAGHIMSVDSLGSAATYDELMRNNVDEVVELLGG